MTVLTVFVTGMLISGMIDLYSDMSNIAKENQLYKRY